MSRLGAREAVDWRDEVQKGPDEAMANVAASCGRQTPQNRPKTLKPACFRNLEGVLEHQLSLATEDLLILTLVVRPGFRGSGGAPVVRFGSSRPASHTFSGSKRLRTRPELPWQRCLRHDPIFPQGPA
ncbi:unnamed protein product [Protopolystoma xenopodis]|uniref:Uncharacterized protein n=1 Tax=Protopolystoma xenopodis TaxID=117903 RepID=A0A448X0G7_9PLAT|nr:unnamed protein product [Protopolystoma xenopodis]